MELKEIVDIYGRAGHLLANPHRTAFGNAICLEWWYGRKKVTVYYDGDDPDTVMALAVDPDGEIDQSELTDAADLGKLFAWLLT